jgi:hypothetical protein
MTKVIDKKIIADIKAVVEYLWDDEERHYCECNKPADHIFLKLKQLKSIYMPKRENGVCKQGQMG